MFAASRFDNPPAVWSPRAQCDKQAYRLKMREVLENQPNLKIKQAEVAELILEEPSLVVGRSSSVEKPETGVPRPSAHLADAGDVDLADDALRTTNDESVPSRILGVKLRDGRTVGAQAVIITTGTFLNGLIHCGEQQYPAGRSGEPNAILLGEALKKLGLRGCRLKTGTPPRLDGRTIPVRTFGRGGHRNQGRVVGPKWRFKQYGQCGKWISDLFPHLATRADDIVRSQSKEICADPRDSTKGGYPVTGLDNVSTSNRKAMQRAKIVLDLFFLLLTLCCLGFALYRSLR